MRSIKAIIKRYFRIEIILLILAIVVILYSFSIFRKSKTEGFYPVSAERIAMQEVGKRRYNLYADIQDPAKEGVIPSGQEGDPVLQKLTDTLSYEGKVNSLNLAGLVGTNPSNLRVPPEQSELLAKIKMCERIKKWDCDAINSPEFAKYCGICTSDGQDHLGNPHIGGLYIDPIQQDQAKAYAESIRRDPNYVPTVGFCKGKFLLSRPLCDMEKDGVDCRKYSNFDTKDAQDKCGQCVYNDKMFYIASRGEKDSNYAIKKEQKITVVLKFVVSNYKDAKIDVYQKTIIAYDKPAYESWVKVPGAFITDTSIYRVSITANYRENRNVYFSDVVKINIAYPTYEPYVYNLKDSARIKDLENFKGAPLIRAYKGDRSKEGDPIVDITNTYPKDSTCLKVLNTPESNAFSKITEHYQFNGYTVIFEADRLGNREAKTYPGGRTVEGFVGWREYVKEDWCGRPKTRPEAEKIVCEDYDRGKDPRRFYGNYGEGGEKCYIEAQGKVNGIVGQWESVGRVSRSVPLDLTVMSINGAIPTSAGPDKLGTLASSKYFKDIMPASKAPDLPRNLFWFSAKDNTVRSINYEFRIPKVLRDPTLLEDLQGCPIGPLVDSEEAKRLKTGACEKLIGGLPQGPGSYSQNCIQSLFIEAGCKLDGKAYPNNSTKVDKLAKDPLTGDNLDMDSIINGIKDLFSIATTGKNLNNEVFEEKTIEKYSIDCLGVTMSNPCDTAFSATGPHTPQCLDYLFRNAGAENKKIGQTYPGMFNRSSGTKSSEKSPTMFCQRAGSMSPIGKDGKYNFDAIRSANAKGGLQSVKEYYRQIHYNANYNTDIEPQKKALNECYGIGVAPVTCPTRK